MIVLLLVALATPPQAVVIATPRGQTSVPVTAERGQAAVAAARLATPLELTVALDGPRATVGLGGAVFVFQLGAPFVRAGAVVCALVGEPYMARDSLFLPLSWLADCVPRALAARYRWDPVPPRLEELPVAGPVAAARPGGAPAPTRAVPAAVPNPLTGLRLRHLVVIDPGHGGVDPGNPGRFFPDGLVEKDITLAIARLLRAELVRRGIGALLTRTADTLIDLADRGAFCKAECDLFVSIHVNAMPAGRRADPPFWSKPASPRTAPTARFSPRAWASTSSRARSPTGSWRTCSNSSASSRSWRRRAAGDVGPAVRRLVSKPRSPRLRHRRL